MARGPDYNGGIPLRTSEANEEKLKDYSTDDQGRRIPAPPHYDRQELIERYHRRTLKSQDLVKEGRKRTEASAIAARQTLQTESSKGLSASDQQAKTQISPAPAFTEPLFPPLPLYGPPSHLRSLQVTFFRILSFFCTIGFLLVIFLGAIFTSLLLEICSRIFRRVMLHDPDRHRKFIELESKRKREHAGKHVKVTDNIPYYAGLLDIEVEQFTCETLDGFTLHLQRLHDRRPGALPAQRKYPVLLLHGLLQSSGAFCVNDEDSLSFYLCRQGFDVWLGNNRCWFRPERMCPRFAGFMYTNVGTDSALTYGDPRLWAWNIRQLGGLDLPALLETVCTHTNRERIGFVAHSQGTTQTFCSLSRDQKPEIGLHLDSFCALAPAVYAGALIDKLQFKFMRILGPQGFRLFFGIHAFIPFMMTMQATLPGSWYGLVGFYVLKFLFGWGDSLWGNASRT